MGMDRVSERLRAGVPLRVGEFAELIGYSAPTVRKMIDAGAVRTVGLTDERRIPLQEARRISAPPPPDV